MPDPRFMGLHKLWLAEKLSLWGTQPLMGRSRDELAAGIRSVVFGRYTVFLEPLPDGIDIVQVLHGSRDIDKHLDH